MRYPSLLHRLAIAATLVGAVSCANTSLVSSLDDLTANVSQQGFLTLEQQRVLSLSGLAPSGPPGSVYRYKGNRSPFTSIGVSAVKRQATSADEDSNKKTATYYVERTVGESVALEDLTPIRDQLVNVRLLASRLIRARLDRLVAIQAARAADPPQDTTAHDQAVASAQTDFDTAWNGVITSVTKEGVVVLQTRSKEATSLSARIGAILGLSSSTSVETGGFAVLGGIRTSFLYLGTDFVGDDWPGPPGRDWSLIGTRFPFILRANDLAEFPWIIGQFNYEDCKVVTSKLEAKYVLYARDQLSEREIQANLKASVEQLKNIDKTLREVEEVAIEGTLASVESLGNIGVLGPVTERHVKLRPDGSRYAIDEQGIEVEGMIPEDQPLWRTVYQVMSDYNELALFVTNGRRFHFTRLF